MRGGVSNAPKGADEQTGQVNAKSDGSLVLHLSSTLDALDDFSFGSGTAAEQTVKFLDHIIQGEQVKVTRTK
jgi:hypothetical protein